MKIAAQSQIHVLQRRALRDMIVVYVQECAQHLVVLRTCGVTEESTRKVAHKQTRANQWKEVWAMMVMRAKEFAQKIVPLMKSGVMGEWTLMDAKWKLHARHGPGDLMVKNAIQIAQ